ncbi:MAG: hypothetical protein R6X16_02750, partial [Anaerolineae bacterium]
QNSGVEFAVSYQTLPTRKFLWSTDFNFAKFFDTKLVKITDTLTGSTSIQARLGAPAFSS